MIKPDKHKDTGKWRARYTDPNGKVRSAGTFNTLKEAQKAAREKENQIQRADWDNPDLGVIRFEDWAPTALNRLGKDGKPIGVRTRVLYESQLRNHLLPTFGRMRLRDIRRGVVQDWLRTLPDAPNKLNC